MLHCSAMGMNIFPYGKVLQIGVTMEHISFQIVEFGSDAFFKIMNLREEVLYKPIGLSTGKLHEEII